MSGWIWLHCVCVCVCFPYNRLRRLIVSNSSPAAIMEVHEDFFMYNSGIYKHTDVSFTKPPQFRKHGTHSVKITG